jgi:hypothetical protein
MDMGDIMRQLEDDNANVASAMSEVARKCAASGLIPAAQATRLGQVFVIYMMGVRWDKCRMSHVSSCSFSSFALNLP